VRDKSLLPVESKFSHTLARALSKTNQKMSAQVIIVGGGLSGLSAAHTVLERGGSVCLIDKNPFYGGTVVFYMKLFLIFLL
jgi:heterodisulfide reductase subunit A-like polyferredoxin